jgi:hypothetical protein
VSNSRRPRRHKDTKGHKEIIKKELWYLVP